MNSDELREIVSAAANGDILATMTSVGAWERGTPADTLGELLGNNGEYGPRPRFAVREGGEIPDEYDLASAFESAWDDLVPSYVSEKLEFAVIAQIIIAEAEEFPGGYGVDDTTSPTDAEELTRAEASYVLHMVDGESYEAILDRTQEEVSSVVNLFEDISFVNRELDHELTTSDHTRWDLAYSKLREAVHTTEELQGWISVKLGFLKTHLNFVQEVRFSQKDWDLVLVGISREYSVGPMNEENKIHQGATAATTLTTTPPVDCEMFVVRSGTQYAVDLEKNLFGRRSEAGLMSLESAKAYRSHAIYNLKVPATVELA